ncbi:MAG TPA: peptidase, partial [Clostridiaceae bacterium]|nr:peptidase [Clostridiaceae bacterium]
MDKVELLAPAGNMDSLKAAVENGADAVYIGGKKFSARQYAGNFDNDDIKKAVDYCHIRGVKVYITLNILLKDNELYDVPEYVAYLYSCGVDALIIQDMGVGKLIRDIFPDFELHASTQMTAHNLASVDFLYNDLGYKRVVLSRELSIDQIEIIASSTKAEIEVFAHGALCICYSGQCLMSSMIGGRSGNR